MKTNIIAQLFLILVTGTGLTACSMKDRTQAYQVNVEMPNSSSSQNSKFLSHAAGGTTTATGTTASGTASGITSIAAAAGFRCFALNIVGSGISADPRFQCDDPSMGQLVGMADISGGTVSADVLAGPSRTIQLIGVVVDATSTLQGCPTFDSILSAAADPGKALNGVTPYNLGQTTTDIFNDTSVSIVANFASTTKMFNACGNDSNNENGPSASSLGLSFTPAYPNNLNYGPTILTGVSLPGIFRAIGGKAPYVYSFTAYTSSNAAVTEGTLIASSDTLSAIYHPASTPTAQFVTLKVVDASGAVAYDTVPISGTAIGGKIFGPFAAAIGSCIPLQLAAVDSNGQVAFSPNGITGFPTLQNPSVGGSIYSDSSCTTTLNTSDRSSLSIPVDSIMGTFGAYPTVYYKNTSASTGTGVNFNISYSQGQLILNGSPSRYFFSAYTGTSLPQGLCMYFQVLLSDANGTATSPNPTADGTSRTVVFHAGDALTQVYADPSCTSVVNSFTFSPFQASSAVLYARTTDPVGTNSAITATDQTGLTGSQGLFVTSPTTATPTPVQTISPTPTPVPTPSAHLVSVSRTDLITLSVSFSTTMNSSSSATSTSISNPANYLFQSTINTINPLSSHPGSVSAAGNGANLFFTSGTACATDTITVASTVLDASGLPIATGFQTAAIPAISETPPYAPNTIVVKSGTSGTTPTFTIGVTYFSAGDRVVLYTESTCTTPVSWASPSAPFMSTGSGTVDVPSSVAGHVTSTSYQVYAATVSSCGKISACSILTATW